MVLRPAVSAGLPAAHVAAHDDGQMPLPFQRQQRFAVGAEAAEDVIDVEAVGVARGHDVLGEVGVVFLAPEEPFLRLDVQRRLGRRLRRHRGVDLLVQPQHLAGDVHVQRAAAAGPAIDFEIDRDVIGEVVAVEVNLAPW